MPYFQVIISRIFAHDITKVLPFPSSPKQVLMACHLLRSLLTSPSALSHFPASVFQWAVVYLTFAAGFAIALFLLVRDAWISPFTTLLSEDFSTMGEWRPFEVQPFVHLPPIAPHCSLLSWPP